jgi:SAM-dependent methyltransferase
MMTSPNQQQVYDWNGALGERWTTNQDSLDMLLQSFADAVLTTARLQAGERVLDIGCGCGATTLAAAAQVAPDGVAIGVDISAIMLDRARQRAAASGSAARFVEADASVTIPEGAPFDALFSRFGVMFFEDPTAAFANLIKTLRPDGRLAFVCWRPAVENIWMTLALDAARPALPPLAPAVPDAPGPFAFARRERIATILDQAGFTAIEIAPMDTMITLAEGGSPAEAAAIAVTRSVHLGPLAAALRDQPDEIRDAALALVQAKLETVATPAGIALPAATWMVTARRK